MRARLHERTTYMGLVAIALALALLIVPTILPAEASAQLSENIKWLITALFVGGLGGVIFPEKRP